MDIELLKRLATEAGLDQGGLWVHADGKIEIGGLLVTDELWCFAQLVAQHCAAVAEQGVAEIDSEDMLVAGAHGAANDIRRAFGLPIDEPQPRPEWIAAQKART